MAIRVTMPNFLARTAKSMKGMPVMRSFARSFSFIGITSEMCSFLVSFA